MTLYGDLITLKQQLGTIREDLGDPRLVVLGFGNPPESELTLITPKVRLFTVPSKYVGLPLDPNTSKISVAIDDYFIKDVSRSYTRNIFYKKAWVNPVVNDSGGVIKGIACRCYVIEDKSSSLSYTLILRKDIEQVRLF